MRDAAGRHNAVDVGDAAAEAAPAVAELEPVDGTRRQNALFGIGGRLDVANLGAAEKELLRRPGEVEGGRGLGVKVVVAEEGGADILGAEGEVAGRAGEGIGGVGLVVGFRIGRSGDAGGSGHGPGGGGNEEVEGDGLVPEDGGGEVGVGLCGVERCGVVKDREGACVDGSGVGGGAGVVLDAVANGEVFKGEARGGRGEVGRWRRVLAVGTRSWIGIMDGEGGGDSLPVLGRVGVVEEEGLHLDAGAASAVATKDARAIVCVKCMAEAVCVVGWVYSVGYMYKNVCVCVNVCACASMCVYVCAGVAFSSGRWWGRCASLSARAWGSRGWDVRQVGRATWDEVQIGFLL